MNLNEERLDKPDCTSMIKETFFHGEDLFETLKKAVEYAKENMLDPLSMEPFNIECCYREHIETWVVGVPISWS